MAQVISHEQETNGIMNFFPWLKLGLFSLALGVLVWGATLLLQSTVIEPIYCGANGNLQSCGNALQIAGNVAMVLGAVIAVIGLIRLRVSRPLLVVLAATIVLWGIASWTAGMSWFEVAAWHGGMYALAMVSFGWIARVTFTPLAIGLLIIVTAVVRTLILL